jgi:hypothetical protein
MEVTIKGNGIKINLMDMGNIIILIEIGFSKVSGELDVNKDLGNRPILMELFSRVTIVRISNKETEFLYLTLIV